MKQIDLMKLAAKGYGRREGDRADDKILDLSDFFDEETGLPIPDASGDGLAKFVVQELSETFEDSLSDEEQKAEAIRVIQSAIRDLEGILAVLENE